ncbi:SusC/RagA family TonB-linked outer membrane protein [Emticicia sp. CRIBPO]|uniref:SusC/RagA family TonB-linked outer membrane protein n=1 Tax=Emticicia sp. CRIBPO TaxID=2683258 RepID=UPI0014126FEA|nr:TonB-dependent receptor [Emticicia sp. CRIBPO]NBA88703.1 SusC/RagA family TonB-linked outer membrane protein [Emticicia sp. CRIBPO]
MRKSLFLTMLLVSLTILSYGQNKISGKVSSADDGTAIPGVSVQIKGTSKGTQANADGNYSIEASSGQVLVFSFVGMETKEVTVGNSSIINVSLTSDLKSLSEVVVTGYATQKRTEFTGAASTIKATSIAERPVQSFSQGLTGQAAGVAITQPNGLLNNPPVIRVRGLSSLSLSSFPLVVIDGIPVATDNISGNASTNNPLGDINPSDIESIDVLKDAASSAIYGSRAAAGVLLITTKRGKQGKAKVSIDSWAGVSNAVRLPDVLNAQQYMDHKNAAIANALLLNPNAVTAAQRNDKNQSFLPSYNADGSLVDTDWYKEVYQTAFSQNHNLTVTGGTDKTSYYFSAGFSDQDGFLRNNSFQRRSGRFNMDHEATKWLKFTANVNYTNSTNKAPNSGSNPGGAFSTSGLGRIAVAQVPNVPAYNEDGSYNLENNTVGRKNNLLPAQFPNPATVRDLDKNISETNRIISNLGAELKLYEGLTFKTTYSWDRRNTEDIRFWNPYSGDGWSTSGDAYNRTTRSDNWNWINTLQYSKTFAEKHNVSLVVGSDAQKRRTTNWGAERQTLADFFFTDFQGNFGTNLAAGNGISQVAYEAYLGSVSYNYGGKYFISGNYRRDGNSALSTDNRWGNFGGVSAGWTISEEEFFKNLALGNKISSLRLKASWGKVGNGNLSNAYGSYSTFASSLYGAAPTLAFNQAGNKDLKWETSSQTNIGLDVSFLNDRITLEANYYNKDIDNMVLNVPQAPSKGIPGNTILANVGSMYNRGWEFAITAVPINKGGFTWSTNINFSTNKNMVTSLVDDNTPILQTTSGLETTSITKVGYSASQVYGVKTNGVNPQNGRRIFVRKDGKEVQYLHLGGANAWTFLDGTPTTSPSGEAVILGNTLPTWYGGFNNNFKYKGFDLALNFTYSGGNYIYNGSKAGLRDQRVWNNSVDVLNSWKKVGDITDIPRAVYGDNVSNGSSFLIDANLEKGDFLRLQTATLGYRIPASVFGKSGITSIRVYTSINNAFLLTKYTGSDPEISTNGDSNLASGIERNSIPQGRQFTFGLNLGL